MANRARGENAELRADLNSQYRDPRKEAIKRVIASMTGQYSLPRTSSCTLATGWHSRLTLTHTTVGKDVSGQFQAPPLVMTTTRSNESDLESAALAR